MQTAEVAYVGRVHAMIDQIPLETVALLVEHLKALRERGSIVYVLGNGGSDSLAQHLVLHLRDCNIRAFDLQADHAWVTAQSNDHGYKVGPVALLNLNLLPTDMLFLISGSGNSENVKIAARMADARQARCVGILGSDGGRVLPFTANAIVLPGLDYGPLEDTFSVVIHILHEELK